MAQRLLAAWTSSLSEVGETADQHDFEVKLGAILLLGLVLARYVSKAMFAKEGIDCSKPRSSSHKSTNKRGSFFGRGNNNDEKTTTDIGIHPRLTLSLTEPFVSKEVVKNMTLQDMAHVFSYASQVNTVGFDLELFFTHHENGDQEQGVRAVTQTAIQALHQAMAISRGSQTQLVARVDEAGGDTMDALAFCGAVRIFTEWRSLRCIPKGYGKYAFGMSLSHRDICQNIKKMEEAVHGMLLQSIYQEDDEKEETKTTSSVATEKEEQQSSKGGDMHVDNRKHSKAKHPLLSPTIRELLQHEVESNRHPSLPVLVEESAGSGFLWIKRQITYYGSTLENGTNVPIHFPDPRAAYFAAYEAVYGPFHSIWTRTMILSTIDSCPTAVEMNREMNIPYTETDAGENTGEQNPSHARQDWQQCPEAEREEAADEWGSSVCSSFDEEESNASERSLRIRDAEEHSIEKSEGPDSGIDVGDKILQSLSFLFGMCVCDEEAAEQDGVAKLSRNNVCSSYPSLTEAATLSSKKNDIPNYLSTLRPLESGWQRLIEDVNMNDPTRV
eukprot:CAMPEP_0172474324 /NCGR_PEP_ID=MMETSP1065-20121228/69302_1 /TAXON_ID=265537 /ORGANISM="Amphiprora paludosa, Strain CCMP125" /LENGTH=555 /DNA_ID=CAMNT_0013232503 /DNA_START=502 /DNA_END=2170 /DNA_ORIENTATION=-